MFYNSFMKSLQILKNHTVLAGLVFSILLFMAAVFLYPGGSYFEPYSQGFDWQHNYFSNLFSKTAINGMPNSARFWSIAGMFFLCLSFALFFIRFTKNISSKSGQVVIKYAGVMSMIFAQSSASVSLVRFSPLRPLKSLAER